jgi:hypothetical protein
MNQSNQTNQTAQLIPLDFLLDLLGQSIAQTATAVGIFPLLSTLGFITNILSFFIFRDPELTMPMYDYLKVYSLNSSVVCLVSIAAWFALSYRWISWANAYWSIAYNCYVFNIFGGIVYFFGTYLDILITIDRIGNITNRQLIKY